MKGKKHLNILKPSKKSDSNACMEIVCRGCSMRNREELWGNFKSSIYNVYDREIDNSFLFFEEEPDNQYDPNAIMVVVKGEFFGTVGYVGKEYTASVKDVLNTCKEYRIDMVDEKEVGNREIRLLIQWV